MLWGIVSVAGYGLEYPYTQEHAKYAKTVKLYNKFKAHDEKGIAKLGDTVVIVETRPLSKDKHFIVKQVIKQAEDMHLVKPEEIV